MFGIYDETEFCALAFALTQHRRQLLITLAKPFADSVLADLDRLYERYHREINGAGMAWWKKVLLPRVASVPASAYELRENRLRTLRWILHNDTLAESVLHWLESSDTRSHSLDLPTALHIASFEVSDDPDAYERQLIRLTRAECRDLLGTVESKMRAYGWSEEQFFLNCSKSTVTCNADSFMSRLRDQAGEYEAARTRRFENLSAEQAANVLRQADLNSLYVPTRARESLKQAARRSAEIEQYYDTMNPQAAWEELCRRTGRLDFIEYYACNRRTVASVLLYEAQTLLPDQDVAGLIRASHLLADAGAVPGLKWQLQFPDYCSPLNVARAIRSLAPYEAFVIERYLREKAPSPAQLAQELGIADFYDYEKVRPRVDNLLRYFRGQLAQRAAEYAQSDSLQHSAAQAVTRADAWRELVRRIGGSANRFGTWTLEARKELAFELMRRHPAGLPGYLEMLAVQAILGPQLRDPEVLLRVRVQALDLAGRLSFAGAKPEPWTALLMLSPNESRRLLEDLCAIATGRSAYLEQVTQLALHASGLFADVDVELARRFLSRLTIQAGRSDVFPSNARLLDDELVTLESEVSESPQVLRKRIPQRDLDRELV